jgi:hypothetical protein
MLDDFDIGPAMQRRTLLQTLFAAPALSLMAPAHAQFRPPSPFDAARWAPLNAARIEAVIAQCGKDSPSYDPAHKPYAVFDWDNTSIMNDCQEALLMYQIENLAFNFTDKEFSRVLRQDLPGGPINPGSGYATVDGKPVSLQDLADDIAADYAWLRTEQTRIRLDDEMRQTPHVGSNPAWQRESTARALDAIRKSAQFEDFRAKLCFMYDAICDVCSIEVGYKWVIYLLANYSPAEIAALAQASNDQGLGDGLRKIQYISPRELPGKAGVVATTHFHGLRIHEEMRALMHALRAAGFDVYVSTASLDDVVRVFAGHPNYGYGVPPENVIGLRLDLENGKYLARYRKGWHFNWGPGKTVGIQNELVSKKGYGPAIVFGDSDGDAWMLRDFADTRLAVIVNRLKKGEIGIDSQKAAAAIGQPDARFVLQGRDERTGIMIPDEKTVKYGQTEKRLLA